MASIVSAAIVSTFALTGIAAAAVTGMVMGAVVGAVVGGVTAAITGGNILKGVLMGGLMGAATGLVTGGIVGAFSSAGSSTGAIADSAMSTAEGANAMEVAGEQAMANATTVGGTEGTVNTLAAAQMPPSPSTINTLTVAQSPVAGGSSGGASSSTSGLAGGTDAASKSSLGTELAKAGTQAVVQTGAQTLQAIGAQDAAKEAEKARLAHEKALRKTSIVGMNYVPSASATPQATKVASSTGLISPADAASNSAGAKAASASVSNVAVPTDQMKIQPSTMDYRNLTQGAFA